MAIKLGINTGFALNRFSSPQEWIPLVAEEFGLKVVQFTADLLNPSLPDEIIAKELKLIKHLSQRYGLRIEHTFTSAFTRVNHLAHPNPEFRKYWLEWFKKFVDISVELGAISMGSHLGIFTVKDEKDPKLKSERFAQVVEGWNQISKYARQRGLRYLMWEPMSIAREMGETIDETKRIQKVLSGSLDLPIKLCLDVDHGDVCSSNPSDTDPFVWIREFSSDVLAIHLKQTLTDKGGHWPFTDEYNRKGKITPQKIIPLLNEVGLQDVTLLLELSFREREPFESRVVDDIKASVEYWRPYVGI